MRWIPFPDPQEASPDGIIAMGGDLSVDLLVSAYSQGIFPWPHEGYPLLWFCPWERGVLDFEDLHVSRSLEKLDKKITQTHRWQWTIDRAFAKVITACAQVPRAGSTGTWITEEMLRAYENLHRAGFAHSLEVWEQGELVGGIYGVFVKNVFSAESMFFYRPNASKWAFLKLVTFLQQKGLQWMDVQMLTNVCQSFGAKLISQDDFFTKHRKAGAEVPIPW